MLNKAILMGRLTADPELRTTQSGTSVCSFCIAINRQYSKDKEAQADFIDIVAWRQTAEFIVKYFRKGRMIIIDGFIQTRMFEDKNGNKRKAVEVVAGSVQFGEGKQAASPSADIQTDGDNKPPAAYSSGESGDFVELMDSEDLPF